jgi:hypothetical protein
MAIGLHVCDLENISKQKKIEKNKFWMAFHPKKLNF